MSAYRQEKIDNAICYIAKEYKKKTRKVITQIYLYKILSRIDFFSVRDTGRPAFDMTYRAMDMGPVPLEIYNKRRTLNTSLYKFVMKKESWGEVEYIYPKDIKPNVDYFSDFELKLMNDSIFIVASSNINSTMVSIGSHQEIKAWDKARKTKGKDSIMDYADEFEDDISKIKEEDLTEPEHRFLLWESMKAAHRE